MTSLNLSDLGLIQAEPVEAGCDKLSLRKSGDREIGVYPYVSLRGSGLNKRASQYKPFVHSDLAPQGNHMKPTKVFDVFRACAEAIMAGVLIHQVSKTDKEFHFQNWFEARLNAIGLLFDKGGRNSYPDFTLVEFTEGYEVKGLAWPGRESTYDSNSQAPAGFHNGRDVFYVFGRYPPADLAEQEYPVIDLVICHGDFLNADHDYRHKNKNVKGFGSYGDIMIRDRKMYVARTPFAIANGFTGARTLVAPATWTAPAGFQNVGSLDRVETATLVVGYDFDLRTNNLAPKTVPNPSAGKVHSFCAYRLMVDSSRPVALTASPQGAATDAEAN